LPARLVKLVLQPAALRIFAQDARILGAQSENITRFGGEQFMNTELDLMGPAMWRLLKQAESGDNGAGATEAFEIEKEIRFWA
jgi:hypothetical protein